MPEEQGALTEAVFYILLALHRPLHGYGIMQLVQDLTAERVVLGPGTLYGALATLVEKGWIQALPDGHDSRRKEYKITELGGRIFQIELERLQELLDHAQTARRKHDEA